MSLTSKQIDELRAYAKDRKGELAKLINDAADTIELLSTKLSAANMERSSQYYHDGWIPCSERLPNKGDVVLITNGNHHIGYGKFRGTDFELNGKTYWWWKGNTSEHVIAWMPLPEPWKGDEDD